MFQMYSSIQRRNHADEKDQKELETTGHDRFYQERSRSSYRKKKYRHVRRTQSHTEFETRTNTAAHKRHLFRGRSVSTEQENSETEHSEKSPLVSTKSLAKLLFSRSTGSQDSASFKDIESSPTRCNVKYQYSAILDSSIGASDRSPRERAARDRAFTACTEWLISTGGRYEIIYHLDDIGSRANKHWFLLNDSAIKTNRLMTLLPLPSNCIALEELPNSECPQGVLMELLGSLQHPYIYPSLDLGFFHSEPHHYACLVMPFNPKGSLKELIYKTQWNEPWNRKYTRKAVGLPMSQVQRLGRQILEALLFLRDRGIPSHGHLHSGNVILQNGVARLSGLENELLGLDSQVNAVHWSRSSVDIENIDVICFGHLLFEMCSGFELSSPAPTKAHLQIDLERYPQVVEVLQMIFDSPSGFPTLEEIVLCDLFRNIDLREMRGSCIPSFKHSMSSSTMSLLNAVRKRHSTVKGSFSEGSSPCTPPSTPRDRQRKDDSASSSDSDQNLDEIIVSTIDPEVSPIHYCNKGEPSTSSSHKHQLSVDEKGMIIKISSFDEAYTSLNVTQKQSSHPQCSQQSLDPSSAYKNSKTRRTEYSMKGMKIGCSNPSQDSAFGSMTDGELSRASSFKLSSFQSVSSPIDEGVEDILQAKRGDTNLNNKANNFKFIDSNSTCSSSCPDNFTQSLNDLKIPDPPLNPIHSSNIKETCIYFDPPMLLINDHSSSNNYGCTSSPMRKCITTEVFSQKYRVSSFEDMALSSNHLKNNIGKKQYRSFEEEQRIESAFTPISSSSDIFEDVKHSTSSISGKERSISWKVSLNSSKSYRNNSTLDSNEFMNDLNVEKRTSVKSQLRNNDDEEDEYNETSVENSSAAEVSTVSTLSKRRSDRLLFCLAKFKQNAIVESVALDTLSESSSMRTKKLSNSSSSNDESNIDNTTITSTTNDECNSEEECSSLTESLLKTPSIDDVRKFVKSFDFEDSSMSAGNSEEAPLLEMLSMSSSTEPE